MQYKIDSCLINDKPVYIFDKHHYTLLPWATIRNSLNDAPYLITLDWHADKKDGFVEYFSFKVNDVFDSNNSVDRLREEYIKTIKLNDPQSLEEAISRLKNDEHIEASTKMGLINMAFIISYKEPESIYSLEKREVYKDKLSVYENKKLPPRPHTYDVPHRRIFLIGANVGRPSSESRKEHLDAAIESDYLSEKLSIIDEMSRSVSKNGVFKENYILDIDLDYFKTFKSIEPEEHDVFYDLIRGAIAVTIAREPICVKDYAEEGIDSKYLETKLIQHIRNATK